MSDKHDTILVYACRHSAYRAADEAGRKRLTYSPRVEIVPLPCSGAVSVHEIILSLENEADGVIIMGCNQGSCHHQNGNHWAEQRAGEVRKNWTKWV